MGAPLCACSGRTADTIKYSNTRLRFVIVCCCLSPRRVVFERLGEQSSGYSMRSFSSLACVGLLAVSIGLSDGADAVKGLVHVMSALPFVIHGTVDLVFSNKYASSRPWSTWRQPLTVMDGSLRMNKK